MQSNKHFIVNSDLEYLYQPEKGSVVFIPNDKVYKYDAEKFLFGKRQVADAIIFLSDKFFMKVIPAK